MALEVGQILEGKVAGITNFGVFVDLPGGKTGMVHISEVARAYVREIKDYVSLHQMVRVKVLNIGADGKISLSMKQAAPEAPAAPSRSGPATDSFEFGTRQRENMSFEDMMSKFKQSSDEKMGDLKKVIDQRRGSQNRRSNLSR